MYVLVLSDTWNTVYLRTCKQEKSGSAHSKNCYLEQMNGIGCSATCKSAFKNGIGCSATCKSARALGHEAYPNHYPFESGNNPLLVTYLSPLFGWTRLAAISASTSADNSVACVQTSVTCTSSRGLSMSTYVLPSLTFRFHLPLPQYGNQASSPPSSCALPAPHRPKVA